METLVGIVISAIWAMVPVFAYSLFVWRATWHMKSFSWLLAVSVFWGALPAFAFLLLVPLSFLLGAGPDLADPENHLWLATLFVPMAEEGLKTLSILGLLAASRKQGMSVTDGLIYGSLVGFGFSMVEDFWYYLSRFESSGLSSTSDLMMVRGLLGAFNHAVYSGLAGAGLGMAFSATRPAKWIWAASSFIVSIGLHSVYNFTSFILDDNFISNLQVELMLASMITNSVISASGVLMIFAVMVGSWNRVRKILITELLIGGKNNGTLKIIKEASLKRYPPVLMPPSSRAVILQVLSRSKESSLKPDLRPRGGQF